MDSARWATAHLMGTDVHVAVVGPDAAIEPSSVVERLAGLERRWSRFVPESEVSALNARDGGGVLVSADTAELLARSVEAWHATAGRFDPFVGDLLVELGYDGSFPWSGRRGRLPAPRPSPAQRVHVDVATGLVDLGPGTRFDPGGIGKGCAADLVVDGLPEHLAAATGVLVNVGGDLRVWGVTPAGGWEVEVDHLVGPPVRVSLTHGALATSSTRRRRWPLSDGGEAHHVVDPSTCGPVTGPVASVSVLAGEAWWAEAVATAVLVGWGIDGPDPVLVDLSGDLGVLVTTNDGEQFVLGGRGSEFMVVAPEADGTLVESNVLEGSCREVVG